MTLDDGITTITLPDSLEWVDEFDFSPVTQKTERTIGGSFIIQEASLLYGRPITLEGGEFVWMDRDVFKQLVTLAETAGKQFTLTMPDASTYTVILNRENGAPFSAAPLLRQNVYDSGSKVNNIVLRFFTIETPPVT